jgi:hypothetical protein
VIQTGKTKYPKSKTTSTYSGLTEFKQYLLRNWGKKCKDYSALCGCCEIWRAFETIESLESEAYHLTNWEKVHK